MQRTHAHDMHANTNTHVYAHEHTYATHTHHTRTYAPTHTKYTHTDDLGDENDPALTLFLYFSTLEQDTDEEIDFDRMQELISNGASVNAASRKQTV